VHIQHYLSAEKLGNDCGKNQKIRHSVNLNYIVSISEVQERHGKEIEHERCGIFEQIMEYASPSML
jgi:hypothetical protein